MNAVFARLRQFDAYAKPAEDFRVRTLSGGAVTLISAFFIILLFIGELRYYLTKEIVEELFVDTSKGDEDRDRLKINFDLTFPALSCQFVSVDAMDISGEQQSDVQHDVTKVRLDKDGLPGVAEKAEIGTSAPIAGETSVGGSTTTEGPKCLSCYGAETPDRKCCNTCEEVKDAYRRRGWAVNMVNVEQCKDDEWVGIASLNEGCRVHGSVTVAKVSGNFHIAPGRQIKEAHVHVHDLHSIGPQKFNSSHIIRHLSFGDAFPGKNYPLDGSERIDSKGGQMFQYFVKIVPTTYEYADQEAVLTHQFSVTKHTKTIGGGGGHETGLPGFFVMYEFSPLMVKLTEKKKSFAHFLTSVCAIVGGVFTVASLIDAFLYHSGRVLKQKIQIGKMT